MKNDDTMREEEDRVLLSLIHAIIADDPLAWMSALRETPALATTALITGATRQRASEFFFAEIGHHLYKGDTALHVAAAAYRPHIAHSLIEAGSLVSTRNRRDATPLHYAADGRPDASGWNWREQITTIELLIAAGANPNARDANGATPLHRAVRTRASEAVRVLLAHGADPSVANRHGTTPAQLAHRTTGKSGSGSAAAKREQAAIVELFHTAPIAKA